jgi:hypothetical protein
VRDEHDHIFATTHLLPTNNGFHRNQHRYVHANRSERLRLGRTTLRHHLTRPEPTLTISASRPASEPTERIIRCCTNNVRRYVSGYWHLRLANPHQSAHRIPDVSASGYMGPRYPQGSERAFADISRGEIESCAGLDTGMSCIAT